MPRGQKSNYNGKQKKGAVDEAALHEAMNDDNVEGLDDELFDSDISSVGKKSKSTSSRTTSGLRTPSTHSSSRVRTPGKKSGTTAKAASKSPSKAKARSARGNSSTMARGSSGKGRGRSK